MKKIITTFYALTLMFGLNLNAQDKKAQTNTSGASEIAPNEAKTRFVKNQDYLSASSMILGENYNSDSLRGFNEAAVKADLLTKGVYGSEYLNYLPRVKRDYINRKYGIGNYKPVAVTTIPVNTNGGMLGAKPTGGGGAVINLAPCVNEDFESTPAGTYNTANAVTGWTINSGQNNSGVVNGNPTYGVGCNANAIANWNAGSPEFSIVTTPILSAPFIGLLPNSPLGGTRVAQLNDATAQGNYITTRLRSTFPVTAANTLFQFAYAGSWDGVHECCGQPAFRIDMYQEPCAGGTPTLMTCSNVSLTPSGAQCTSGVPGYSVSNGVSWTNWVVRFIDLTPYIGQCVTIQITNSDCSYGGHHGSAYFDARCGGQLIGTNLAGNGGFIPGPVSFCAGSNQAVISAPLGYSTYSWVPPITSPPIPSAQATLSTLSIQNPVPNSVYTVYLTGSSGCQYTSTNAIVFTSVNIAGIGSTSTCAGGASGSATVQGFGSGTGYNYTWISAATSATISSGSVPGNIASVNGLAPGVYSVVLSGLGAAGCGSAVATTTVSVGPAGIISVLKPYCGTEAYLSATGGSNFQWYNGTSAISPTAGGQAMSYTVTNPVNQSIYWLSYLSQFGCQDSVKFTLVASTPGILGTPQVSWICPGGTNGTAIITMTPAAGAPPGTNSWSVYALGTTPAYNASIYPTSANSYTASNLAAGSYSIRAFDGSCKYGTSFNVNAFNYTWNVTPTLSALCPGQSVASSITFTSPPSQTQYSYSWTPNVWLAGNANTYSSTIITPVVPVGQNITTIYTVIVTPSLVNCPTTKTISITGINPPIPTITAIPNLCNNSSPYNILVSPTGGTFITGVTGTANPVSLSGGVISPSLALIGSNNSVTYSISVGSCGASSTASYQVNQFNPASLTSSVPPLCVTNAPFNLMNIVLSAANGTWMPASGVTSSGPGAYSFNPANLLTQPYAITYSTTSSPNPTVCPASTVIIVNVTKTITPAITAVPEQCTNFSVKNMTVSPSGGTWYGNSAVSAGGVLTPSAMAVPSSVAFYSVQIGPCVNTNQTTLQASTYNPSSFSGPVQNQCFNGAQYNLMSITQNTTGTWTHLGPGSQTTAIPNGLFLPSAFSPTASLAAVTNTLQYFVASSPNPNLCPSINTLTVSIYHPPTPQISNVGPYCNNASAVQLTVSPASGYWTTSSYLNGNGVFTPSLSNAGNNAVQYVIGTPACFAQQTKFVGVEAFVSAKILTPLPDQCNNGAVVNLTPYTMNNSGNWIGAGIVGNSFNPSMTGAGTFTLIHKTASVPSGLCPDEDQLAVNVFSLATPVLSTLSPVCNNSKPIQIQVSPVGGTFSGVNMGAVSLAGKFSPASAVIGTNLINYSITSGPCKAYVQMTVEVEEFVSAAFTKSVAPICLIPGKTLPVSLNSYVANAGSTWEVNGNFQGENSMFDPNGANIKFGKDNKVVHYTSSSPTGACKDQQEIMIEVRKMPEVKALSNSSVACVPAEIIFNTPSVSDGDGTWNFDDGSDTKPGLTVSHVYTTPGTYNVTFSYKDGIGCEALPAKVSSVRINAAPQADFSFPDEIFISSPQVQLTNLTTVLGDNTYNWKFSNALAPSTEVNPTVNFPAIGKYQVSLTATSPAAAGGCTSQVTKMIEVKNDFYIYIPTAFSPNFDNLNDVFKPEVSEFGLDAKNYEMEIFDRWGHSLFRTTDYKKGWDGKNKAGEPMKEEVYIYRIKYKDSDGNAYSKMGHVSLLK